MNQQISLEEFKTEYMLYFDKFVSFLHENNIQYSLAYGSMLGAVREHNMIQWDCDIDIFMLKKDFDVFLQVVDKLDDIFYFKSYLNDDEIFGLSRVYIKNIFRQNRNCEIRNAYFDIFLLEEKDDDTKKIARVHEQIRQKYFMYMFKISKNRPNNIFKRIFKPIVQLFMPSLKSYNSFCRRKFKIIKNGTKLLTILSGCGEPPILPTPTGYVSMLFGNSKKLIFNNHHELLTFFYGSDYMTPKDFGLTNGVVFLKKTKNEKDS